MATLRVGEILVQKPSHTLSLSVKICLENCHYPLQFKQDVPSKKADLLLNLQQTH